MSLSSSHQLFNQQKIYEDETLSGLIAVYQTTSFGIVLALNNRIIFSENDSFIYHEMIVHPALFTHPEPKKIVVIGNFSDGILQEVLKHSAVKNITFMVENTSLRDKISHYFLHLYPKISDGRLTTTLYENADLLKKMATSEVDIIIEDTLVTDSPVESYAEYFNILSPDGILIQPCQFNFLQLLQLKNIFQQIEQAGFRDWQLIHFPQPSHHCGSRLMIMATKRQSFKHLREKEIFNRNFKTRYYNYDVHKAALVLPEFMREALT